MVVVVWAETQVWYASMLVLAPQQYSPTSWVFLKVTWNPKKWVLQDDFFNLEMSIFMFHHVSILGVIRLRPAKSKQVIAYLIVFIDFPNKTILFLSAGFPIQIYDWLHPLFFFGPLLGQFSLSVIIYSKNDKWQDQKHHNDQTHNPNKSIMIPIPVVTCNNELSSYMITNG